MIKEFFKRIFAEKLENCPTCNEAQLIVQTILKVTIKVNGRRAPELYTFSKCGSCQGRFQKKLAGNFEICSDDNWNSFVHK